jgi:peptidoglycan/LPS O-acetylase OafA/YrhL
MASPLPVSAPLGASFYRPELDGLRFFAFLAVYIAHTFLFGTQGHHHHLPDALAHGLGTLSEAGGFGVDLFYVLSAYLITELLLRERAVRGTVEVPAFYLRRILRIWPLYFLFLALAYGLTFFVPGEELTPAHLLAFALFSGNWMLLLHPVGTVAAPLWSVSVEEQFYLVWPWAVRRGSPRRIVGLMLAFSLLGLLLRAVLARHGVDRLWISKNSFTRADGLVAGAVLATVLRGKLPRLRSTIRTALGLGCLAALVAFAWGLGLYSGATSTLRLTLGWPLVALACAGIVLSVIGGEGMGARLLASRPLVYLGRISYGLYVFHQVGLLVAHACFPQYASNPLQWAAHFAAGLLLTVLLAATSYRWFELPFLELKRRYTIVLSRPVLRPGQL